MTKDGRPSRLNDIRYFRGKMGSLDSYRSASYLEGHDDAWAFGRRMAWLLNGEGFSCGAYTALYILFTPMLQPGVIQVTDKGGDWWQRYVYIGVPENFPNIPDASEAVKNSTVAALKTIRPDLVSIVEDSEKKVRVHGDDLRFLIKSRQTNRYVIELSCNIPIGKQSAYLFTSFTDLSTGAFLEAPPLPIGFYDTAFDYNGQLRLSDIQENFSEFVPRTRPMMSKLVKARG